MYLLDLTGSPTDDDGNVSAVLCSSNFKSISISAGGNYILDNITMYSKQINLQFSIATGTILSLQYIDPREQVTINFKSKT